MLAPTGLGDAVPSATLGVVGPVSELGVTMSPAGMVAGAWSAAGAVASGALGVVACAKHADAVINRMVTTRNCLIKTPAAVFAACVTTHARSRPKMIDLKRLDYSSVKGDARNSALRKASGAYEAGI